MNSPTAGNRIPIVNYLDIDSAQPQLVATVCTNCGAKFLGSRLACASCGTRTFGPEALPATGRLVSYTIIHRAAGDIPTPFVSALVELDGGVMVKSNLINVDPNPDAIVLGGPVSLTTFDAGQDDDGITAVAFGFEPVTTERDGAKEQSNGN